jgi:hypothetical protein
MDLTPSERAVLNLIRSITNARLKAMAVGST